VRVGVWRQRLGAARAERGLGTYVVAEQMVWRGAGSRSDRSVTLFGQWGHSSSVTCSTDRHVGGGVIWRGALPRRADDAVGFGLTRVRFGHRADNPGDHEVALGPFARIQATSWLALTPDLQFVRTPGGASEGGTKPVATLRFSVEF
jgi:carbohydrate-selective porin OprB